jgi:hypothetical protein
MSLIETYHKISLEIRLKFIRSVYYIVYTLLM